MAERSKRKGGAVVAHVVGVNHQQLALNPTPVDLTPMRGRAVERVPERREEKIEVALDRLDEELGRARSQAGGLDLLALLDQAALQNSKRVIVISSGVTTFDPLDLRQVGWVRGADSIVRDLEQRRLLPRDLRGKAITFAGLGLTAGDQPRLAAPDKERVEQLWLAICRAAGAAECRLSEEQPPAAAPTADQPVPVVPVRTFDSVHGDVERIPAGACTTVVRMPGAVLFKANRADLRPAADKVLRGIARDVVAGATVTSVAGHVADAGPGEGQELSQRRAEAVAARLIALNAPAERVRGVAGYGEADPVRPNFNPDGSFNEPLAAKNRRVEVTVAQADCPVVEKEK